MNAGCDVILYVDLPLDARTYHLAHQRLAPVQIALYGHHTYSSGIGDSIDYILLPESTAFGAGGLPSLTTSQYSEQVVLLPGYFTEGDQVMYGGGEGGEIGNWEDSPFKSKDVFSSTFMLPGEANVYIVPASVAHLHPEFDDVIKALLKADTDAFVILGVREHGSEEAHQPDFWFFQDDLMQHSFPPVWAEKLKMRMKKKIAGGRRGGGLWRRVRFISNGLLSNDYAAVLKNADVVLDTIPFGR